MKTIIFYTVIFISAVTINSCSDSNPVFKHSDLNSSNEISSLIASGQWTILNMFIPESPSLPVPLSDTYVYIEKTGTGIVTDTLISGLNGIVRFNINGQFKNGDYIVYSKHRNKEGIEDRSGLKQISYATSPSGIYEMIILEPSDPIFP